jgi:hypothetical protein
VGDHVVDLAREPRPLRQRSRAHAQLSLRVEPLRPLALGELARPPQPARSPDEEREQRERHIVEQHREHARLHE